MFVFISGTKVKYQSIGQYEDYCPIHRGLHAFEQQQVRSQSHVYGIGYGKTQAEQIAIGMSDCRYVRPIEPAAIESAPANVRWQRRLATEQNLRMNPASVPETERIGLFHESIAALESAYPVPEDVVSRAMRKVAIPAFTVFAFFIVLGVIGITWNVVGWLAFATLALGLPGIVIANQVADSRHKREVFSPLATNALTPLALDPATIKAQLKVAKKSGATTTRRLRKLDLGSATLSTGAPRPVVVS